MKKVLHCIWFVLSGPVLAGDIAVVGDDGSTTRLTQPAMRIVSLAPHVTELVYAVGAGEKLVGVVAHSDYPEQALSLPGVGRYEKINLERVIGLQPDLIIGWISGNPKDAIDKLKDLGFAIYMTNSVSLSAIANHLRNIGELSGFAEQGHQGAEEFTERMNTLTVVPAPARPVRVFYQVWNDPLFTVNGEHLISEIIERCGGINVFEDLPTLAPRINVEAVITANPDTIIASGMGESRPEWLNDWRRWPSLTAVKKEQLFFVHPDHIQRPTPRILSGMEAVCRAINAADRG